MSLLTEVIVFTPGMDGMRTFYERGVGLRPNQASPHWTSYDTGAATLALHPLPVGREREIELTLETDALEGDLRRLRERGVGVGPVRSESFGRFVQFQDPEGNRLALKQSARPRAPAAIGSVPSLALVVVNCRNLVDAIAFYRDVLHLRIAREDTHWVELETGGTRLALHTRPTGLNHPLHAAQKVAYCLEADDLDTWVDEMRARGLHFATAPIAEDFGLYAEALDPDGNIVVFREPPAAPSIEEELAEEFESDEVPHVVAIRKPVLKGVRAASRVALRPEYRETAPARVREEEEIEEALPRPKLPSVRGAGPEHARRKPVKGGDPERIRTRPAVGHLRKAERRTLERKKVAQAIAGKTKPVKKAAKRTAKRKTRGR
jgi:catechol 2,3-dioxygenase-like lactoylglutathione lyase family enzyme